MQRSVFALVLFFAVCASSASAQVLYGSIVGNVTDRSGAAVPDAAVTVVETGTGLTRSTKSNESGQFQFPTVPSGSYKVTVSKTGFTAFTNESVPVSSSTVARVDVSLEVGAVSESVRVDATPVVLQTDRGEVRAEITSRQFENAPLPPGRNYSHLFKVLPGFTYPRNGNGPSVDPSRAAMYNVNGTSQQSNSVRLDGAGVNQIWLPHLPGYTPSLESIETVNITSNSFDAETGLAGGAAVNVSIKSGTNDLHGSLFEYHNSNAPRPSPSSSRRRAQAQADLQSDGRHHRRAHRPPEAVLLRAAMKERTTASSPPASKPFPRWPSAAAICPRRPRIMYDPATGAANGTGRTPFPNNQIPSNRRTRSRCKSRACCPRPTFDSLTANLFAAGRLPVQFAEDGRARSTGTPATS